MNNAENGDRPADSLDETAPSTQNRTADVPFIEIAQAVAHVVLGRELTSEEAEAVQATVRIELLIGLQGVRAEARTAINQRKPSAEKLTPPQLASQWGVSPEKILGWIRSGELRAINAASSTSSRPRFLIDPADIAAFENRRAVPQQETRKRQNRKRPASNVTEFF